MKGLILKDLAIVKTQMRSMLIIFAVVMFMMFMGQNTNFVVMYSNILFMMFGVTTLSYDAFENGHAFLFTLPVTRKLYVKEKYIFSLGCLLIGFIVSLGVLGFTAISTKTFDISLAVGYMFAGIIFLSIMLPIDFKFGPEKARVAMILVVLILVSTGYTLVEVAKKLDLLKYLGTVPEIGVVALLGMLGLIAVAILFASYKISCKIICNKEF